MTERLYYTDSFLESFTARVADIRELSRREGQSVWQIALDRTAFYPESGGQPSDSGVLLARAPSGVTLEVPVLEVEEDEHGEIWHLTQKPLLAGVEVTGTIAWARRLDHMQQHSGQHLLSAVFARELKAQTVSFHLGEVFSTIDLAVESLAASSLERVERLANGLIAEDRPVTARTLDREHAEALLASGELRKLPERDGPLRVIAIEDYDLNACGGTHVRSTGQIGGLLVRGAEKVRQGVRVEFVAGQRAVAAVRREHAWLSRAAAELSVAGEGVPEAVSRLLAEAKAAAKERQKLREELAQYHAARLVVEDLIEDGLRVVRRVFPERDAAYCKLLASRVVAAAPQSLALLASTAEEPATVVMAGSQDAGFHCGELLREELAKLGLRGGGSRDLAQGQVPRNRLNALMDTLAAAARGSLQRR